MLKGRQRLFALEYLLDYDAKRAAIAAGYSEKSAAGHGRKLLCIPKIKRFIEQHERKTQERYEVDRDTILRHLVACATRDGKDFVDDKGRIRTNLKDLPDSVTCAIDSIKQKRRMYYVDGEPVEEITTELKLVSKAAALDMAMRHKGLFAPQEVEARLFLNWDILYSANAQHDPIEERLAQAERAAITVEHRPPNSNGNSSGSNGKGNGHV